MKCLALFVTAFVVAMCLELPVVAGLVVLASGLLPWRSPLAEYFARRPQHARRSRAPSVLPFVSISPFALVLASAILVGFTKVTIDYLEQHRRVPVPDAIGGVWREHTRWTGSHSTDGTYWVKEVPSLDRCQGCFLGEANGHPVRVDVWSTRGLPGWGRLPLFILADPTSSRDSPSTWGLVMSHSSYEPDTPRMGEVLERSLGCAPTKFEAFICTLVPGRVERGTVRFNTPVSTHARVALTTHRMVILRSPSLPVGLVLYRSGAPEPNAAEHWRADILHEARSTTQDE